jgi:hypothetical protein
VEERGVEVPVDEAVVRRGVEPEQGEEDGGHGQGARVDGAGRGPLRSLQVIGEEGGGEGDEGHAHQEKYVEEEQDVVGADDKAESVVVVRPDHPDLEEADHVPEIGWPLLDERPEERRAFDVGNPDLYDEQRNSDGENPVAESLDPARVAASQHTHVDTFLLVRSHPVFCIVREPGRNALTSSSAPGFAQHAHPVLVCQSLQGRVVVAAVA